MRYGSLLNRYRNEPLFKYLFNDGVKTWYPILRKNYGVMMHYSVYAERILELTMSGACPQDYLENQFDRSANLQMDDLKKDDERLKHLNELDPTGENRKLLKQYYWGH